jgi:predicted O-methyltransferase YrrM
MKPHWTIRYFLRRIPDYVDQMTQRDVPWINSKAREALDSLLRQTDMMVECGSGRSTLWFSRRVRNLISIEFSEQWYETVRRSLKQAKAGNVDLRLVNYSLDCDQDDNEYVAAIKALPRESIDVCVIDGGPRSFCAMAIIPQLKPGGLLVIDDVHNFIPSQSKSRNAVHDAAEIPTLYAGRVPLNWRDVYDSVSSWRRLWLSNGIRDTAIFFKPCEPLGESMASRGRD